MAIRYTITITKTEVDVPYIRRDWNKVRDEPTAKHDTLYEYVDSESEKDVTTKIFEQVAEDLDLPAVIKAVNGMDK